MGHRLFPIICWVRLWRTLITMSRDEGFEIMQPQLGMKKLQDGRSTGSGCRQAETRCVICKLPRLLPLALSDN